MDAFAREFPNAKLLNYGLILGWGNLIYGSELVSTSVLDALGLSTIFLISTLALASTYALFIPLSGRTSRLSYRTLAFTGALILSLSSAFLVFAPTFPGLFGFSVFSAILTGMGSALLYLCCAHVYSQTPPRKSMLYALFSLFLAVAIYFMVYGSPPTAGKIAFCLMPLFAVLLLPISTKERLFPQKENGRLPLPRAAWRFAASIALIALIINIGVGYLQVTEYGALYSSVSLGHLISLAIGAALFLYLFRSKSTFDYCQIFYPVVLAAVILLALSYVFGSNSVFVVSFATGIRDILTIIIWCMLVYIMYHQKTLAAFKIFSIGQTFVTLGSVVGNLVGTYFAQEGFIGKTEVTASYLVLIVALVVVITLVFPERVMKRLVVVDPSDLAVFGSDSGGKVRPWKEKCLAFASDVGLTPREHEVFMLIACAKTNEFIAQELTISSLTVKTHRQNIYAKMGVHSAQELIDTIEKF